MPKSSKSILNRLQTSHLLPNQPPHFHLHLVVIIKHLLLGNIRYHRNIFVLAHFLIQFISIINNFCMKHFQFNFCIGVICNKANKLTGRTSCNFTGRYGWATGLACAGVAADSRNAAARGCNDGSPKIIKKFTWIIAAAFFLPGLLIFLK